MASLGALSSEWAKYRRTPTVWLLVLSPTALAAASGWYLSEAGTLISWEQLLGLAYQLWGILCVPIGAALLAGLASVYEERANGWHGLLARPVSPAALYASKLLVLMVHALVATALLNLSLLTTGLFLGVPGRVPWDALVAAVILVWVVSLPLLALQLWVATSGGFGASVAVGIPGLLVAALIGGTSLGNGVWWAVPWAWPLGILGPLFELFGRGAQPGFSDVLFDTGVLLLAGAALASGGLLAIVGAARFGHREW